MRIRQRPPPANQAVTTAQAKTGRLQIVSQKAATTTPTVAATGWALHGRVYDANLNPQERYTVFLVDEQKNYLSDYGFSYTDSTGYFLLQYQGAPASGSSGASETGAATSASTGASGVAATAVAPRAYVQVYDAKAKPVLSSSTPFTPVTGQATYQVLTLPASGQSLSIHRPRSSPCRRATQHKQIRKNHCKTAKTNEESTNSRQILIHLALLGLCSHTPSSSMRSYGSRLQSESTDLCSTCPRPVVISGRSRKAGNRVRILVCVEDQPQDAILAADTIRRAWFRLCRTREYGEALLQIHDQDALEGKKSLPDVILLDLDLGYESGFELLRFWHQNPKLAGCRVIVWTHMGNQREICEMFKVHAVVVKSDDVSELKRVLSRLLEAA